MGIESRYISKSISSYYLRRIRGPLIYIGFLLVIGIVFPVISLFFPNSVSRAPEIEQEWKDRRVYVDVHFEDLYFTGGTSYFLGRTTGYYYYTMWDDVCFLVLLDPVTSEQGNPHITSLDTRACIRKDDSGRDQVVALMAEELEWDRDALSANMSEFVLSEPDATGLPISLFALLYSLSLLYAVLVSVAYVLYIIFPVLSPPVRRLSAYGKASELLAQAEEELSTLPQLATDDMFITHSFFIEVSDDGVALVPIDRIIWIYKYSTLHKFLWHHFSISYTLHITGEKRQYIHCPKNKKTDIDGIIDYLAEANHSILVGFSEENRKRVEVLQGEGALARKIWAFLSRRV